MEKEKNIQKLDNSRYLMKDWFIGGCEMYNDNRLRRNIAVDNLEAFFKGCSYIWVVVAFDNEVVATPAKQAELFFKVQAAIKNHKYDVEAFFEKNAFSFFFQFD